MKKEHKLPEVLRELMKERHISQRKLGDMMGLTESTINKWVKFAHVPSLFSVMALAQIFDVTVDYLIYGE